MAFNPYGFGGYGGMPGMQMPMQQMGGYMPQPVPDQLAQLRMQQQAQQMPPQAPSVIFVDSEDEARAYRVAIGSEVTFLNLNAREMYIKRAVSIGEPPVFKVFDMMEREEATGDTQRAGGRRRPGQQHAEYVTRAELDAAIARAIAEMTAQKEASAHDETTV